MTLLQYAEVKRSVEEVKIAIQMYIIALKNELKASAHQKNK